MISDRFSIKPNLCLQKKKTKKTVGKRTMGEIQGGSKLKGEKGERRRRREREREENLNLSTSNTIERALH